MSPTPLPNEIWAQILNRVPGVKEWGRLQLVSRSFNSVVREQCWVQATKLDIGVVPTGVRVWINGQRFQLTNEKLLLLVDELLRKAAKKIRVVSLLAGPRIPSELGINTFLSHLAFFSPPMKVEELTLSINMEKKSWGMMVGAPLASFISSNSPSLKSLRFFGNFISEIPSLFQAFRRCIALENVEIHTRSRDVTRNILFAKHHLKSLTVSQAFASALLSSRAHLANCELTYECFNEYLDEVKKRKLLADHPLITLKKLTVHKARAFPDLQFFPDLEELNITRQQAEQYSVNELIQPFLDQFQSKSKECRLELVVDLFYIEEAFDPLPRAQLLEEASMLVEHSVLSTEQKKFCGEINFKNGDAKAKLIIKEFRAQPVF